MLLLLLFFHQLFQVQELLELLEHFHEFNMSRVEQDLLEILDLDPELFRLKILVLILIANYSKLESCLILA